MKRVIVHIDRLVLKGFQHADRHAVAEGLRVELGRLLAEPQAAQQWMAHGDSSRLRVSAVHIPPEAKPTRVGTQVAQGIARGIKP